MKMTCVIDNVLRIFSVDTNTYVNLHRQSPKIRHKYVPNV